MMRRFQRYAAKVFDLPVLLARLRDPRRVPLYSTAHVWQSVATLLITGRTTACDRGGSLAGAGRRLGNGRAQR
jgi:hypothetical protein